MSIDFSKTFGANAPKQAPAKSNEPREKSQFWLNVGYDSGVTDEHGKSKFVSLPMGIAVDSVAHAPVTSRNAEYAAFQSARNHLLDQIMAVAKDLAPGEDRMLNLQIQLRRVDEASSELPAEQNVFVRNFSL